MIKSLAFIDYAENLSRICIDQKKLIYFLLTLISLLCFAIIYIAFHKTEYLIPYNMNEKTSISINKVTPRYLTTLAMADAATYFDVDRYNIESQTQLFLTRIDPGSISKTGADMNQRKKQIISDNIAQAFYPINFYAKNNTRFVIIKGRLIKWLSGKLIQSNIIRISIDYSDINGHIFIKKWSYKNA